MPDPDRAALVTKAFEKFAKGRLNQKGRLQQLFFPDGMAFDGKRLFESP